MKRTTAEWVSKAEDDYRGATRLAAAKPPLYDLVSFHCQQCVEKYLKALLEELGIAVPKTHDLIRLFHLLTAPFLLPRSFLRGLDFLNKFAVGIRYAGNNASKRQALATLRWASKVRDAARQRLGLP
jgi:HEPN domain-containing protein